MVKDKSIHVAATQAELDRLEQAADKQHMVKAVWIRSTLLQAADRVLHDDEMDELRNKLAEATKPK